MTGKDALQLQYDLIYRTTAANLSGVTAADSVKQPSPAGNCTNWILAHMLFAHNMVMELVGAEPVMDAELAERAREEPVTGPENAFDWDVMRTAFLGSRERCLGGLAGLTEAQLDEGGFTDPFGQPVTRGQYLNLLAVHQNYHAGQLGLSRRLAGYPGVIGAPEPQNA